VGQFPCCSLFSVGNSLNERAKLFVSGMDANVLRIIHICSGSIKRIPECGCLQFLCPLSWGSVFLCIRLNTNVSGLSMFGFKCQFLFGSLRFYFTVLVQINLTFFIKKKLQDANGLGLKAVSGKDYCRVVIQYPSNTVSKWVSACLLCQAKFLPDADLPFPYFSFKEQLA
jgi:hypothetical protein